MIFIGCLISTIVIELLAAWIIVGRPLWKINSCRNSVVAIIGANCISYPIAWNMFIWMHIHYSWQFALLITEATVVAVETVLLKFQLFCTLKDCLSASLLINGVSSSLGVILWVLFIRV